MPFSKAALLLNYLDSEQLALDLHPLLSVAEDCITMVNNLRAGEGAKAEILTRMIYPRRNVPDKKEKSIVILIEKKTIEINKKQQQCYTFKNEGDDNDQVYYAITRYIHVIEEGNTENLFDPTLPAPEPSKKEKVKKEKWRQSKAKKILYDLLMDGTVPMQDDPNMPLELIYAMDAEFQKTDIDKFKSRLQRLRAHIKDLDSRAATDLEAFRIYKKNHDPVLFSHKGYIQWQGSSAQVEKPQVSHRIEADTGEPCITQSSIAQQHCFTCTSLNPL
jgi:hypothetical protein